MVTRTLRLDGPFDLRLSLSPPRRGRFDPTMRIEGGEVLRATRTPDGPATVHMEQRGASIAAEAWGPGAGFALAAVSDLVGVCDNPADFRPADNFMRDLVRRFPGLRLGRTSAVVEALVPSILEQKVVGKEAWRSYEALVRRYGEPAPGPGNLMVPPGPETLAALPYHSFHPLGVERRRADTVRRACAVALRLEAAAAMTFEDARRRLLAVPGVGPWTAAEVARVALGDPDAVSVGDYHLPHVVAYALAGEARGDDARMLDLLEPYRGQRARAVRLIEASGVAPPRRGPRAPLRAIARQ